jgi:hypothetical protein
LEFDLDIDRPSDLTQRATRALMIDLLKTAGMEGRIDFERLSNLSGLPILLPEDEMEAAVEELPEEPEQTDIEKMGRVKVDKMTRKGIVPPEAREARQQLDIHYQPKIKELENALMTGAVKTRAHLSIWIDECIGVAEKVYEQIKEMEPPVLTRDLRADWRGYAARLWKSYTDSLNSLDAGLRSMRLRGRDVSKIELTQRGNLARKLADKAMSTIFAYFTDLMEASAGE